MAQHKFPIKKALRTAMSIIEPSKINDAVARGFFTPDEIALRFVLTRNTLVDTVSQLSRIKDAALGKNLAEVLRLLDEVSVHAGSEL